MFHVILVVMIASWVGGVDPKHEKVALWKCCLGSAENMLLVSEAPTSQTPLRLAGFLLVHYYRKGKGNPHLEDHPRYRKWLGSPLSISHE